MEIDFVISCYVRKDPLANLLIKMQFALLKPAQSKTVQFCSVLAILNFGLYFRLGFLLSCPHAPESKCNACMLVCEEKNTEVN